MNERTKKIITANCCYREFSLFVSALSLSDREISDPKGLLTEIVGLAGLVGLLAFYNSKYK